MEHTADQRLLERLQQGDDGAMEALSEAYGRRIHQLALRYLRNPEDAEEIVQDVLLKVHRHVREFRGDAALSSWVYRITFNAAMSRMRTATYQRARRDMQSLTTSARDEMRGLADEIPDWSTLADEQVLRSQLRARVRRAIQSLPAIYRAPVVLRDLRGLSTEEASAVLQVKDQTLKSRLHRGRLMLRRQLADFAAGLTLHHATV